MSHDDNTARSIRDTVTVTDTDTGLAQRAELTASTGTAQPHSASGETHTPRPSSLLPRKQGATKCRYFGTKNGCRAGKSCPFLHESSSALTTESSRPEAPSGSQASSKQMTSQGSSQSTGSQFVSVPGRQDLSTSLKGGHYLVKPVDQSKVVQKPVSRAQLEDPRDYQIQQLRRRFSPKVETDANGTILIFGLVPSDPDFPFDLDSLRCTLTVPIGYPMNDRPTLRINSQEMGRGFQINVEKGFDALIERTPNGTLLGWMNTLDKELESLLTTKKADTIKIVANAGPRGAAEPAAEPTSSQGREAIHSMSTPPIFMSTVSHSFTPEQKAQALEKRTIEVRQLEARLGKLPLFFKSSDGLSYIIPIQPKKPQGLPTALQSMKTVKLIIPTLYNLEPCQLELQNVNRDAAAPLEAAFKQRAVEHPEISLMAHINFLSQSMHVMSTEKIQPLLKGPEVSKVLTEDPIGTMERNRAPKDNEPFDARSHIYIIPRPPEWTIRPSGDGNNMEDSSDSYDSGEEYAEDDDEDGGTTIPESVQSSQARGILLSFPYLELYGIELLELLSLSFTVKCTRCKDLLDVKNLKNNDKGDESGLRMETCKKCANGFSIGYRKELMHANSVRAGYLDLDGCIVVDLLPSTFIPTCSECSTPYPAPGMVSVRGESSMSICRECHRKMTFKIPEIKFLIVGASAAIIANRAPPRRKAKESLGIVAGSELPRRGKCTHYGKSYRWFRFSCCLKVFPCDRCHDESSDHPNEHANRMICGYCSREQAYRPEDCGICHSLLTGKKGGGFWEGGKGTRDKIKMSRKDPRKYKRRGGGAAVGGGGKK